MTMIATRDVQLGPLRFIATVEALKETFGDQLDQAGGSITPTEKTAKPFPLTLPVRGEPADTDAKEEGERLRRQARALFNNPAARPLYLKVAFAADVNGWYAVGGGELSETEPGVGQSFGDYLLELTDVFQLATRRTHRPARRLTAVDRRNPAIAKDPDRTVFTDDFSAMAAVARHHLPASPTDTVGAAGLPLAPAAVGLSARLAGAHGDIVSYEQAEADQGKGDVFLLARTSIAEADWEPVYGPDQPLPVADLPVVGNDRCRIRWVSDRSALAIDSGTDGAGWTERARVTLHAGASNAHASTLVSARVGEWTPERATINLVVTAAGGIRVRARVELQRGWAGPRIDAYARSTAGRERAVLRLVCSDGGTTALVRKTTAETSTNIASGGTSRQFAEPWAYLLAPSPALPVSFGLLQDSDGYGGTADLVDRAGVTDAYAAGRDGIDIRQPSAAAAGFGWIAAQFEVGRPRASASADAIDLGKAVLIDARAVETLVPR